MKLQKTIPIGFLVVVGLVLSACAPTSPPASAESLEGTRWALVSFGKPGEETPVIAGSSVTAAFQANGQVDGSGGCNSYGGQYQVEGSTIAFIEIVSTEMACADEQVTAQEMRYLQALSTAGRFAVENDRLSIQYDNGQNVLNFVSSNTLAPVVRDADLMPSGSFEKQYTLPAKAGQTITIEITSDGVPLSLTITSPSGIQRFPEMTHVDDGFRIDHTFSASETGDYRLTLAKADQTTGTNYTATFTVR